MSAMESASPSSPTSPMKRPFASLEHSVIQFNDVLIPHRLDMLKKHKNNIIKYLQLKDYNGASKEQAVAAILVKNISRDLIDIEALRTQVQDVDRFQFDRAIATSKDKALCAIQEFLDEALCEIQEFLPKKSNDTLSWHSQYHAEEEEDDDSGYIPGSVNIMKDAPPVMFGNSESDALTPGEEAYLRSIESLQSNIEDLNSIFISLNRITKEQSKLVDCIEENVHETSHLVTAGNKNLEKAVKYKAAMYPLLGAALGTLIGGPIGMLVGVKTGAGLAVGGSLMGFVGGRLLKKKAHKGYKNEEKGEDTETNNDCTYSKNSPSTSVLRRR